MKAARGLTGLILALCCAWQICCSGGGKGGLGLCPFCQTLVMNVRQLKRHLEHKHTRK